MGYAIEGIWSVNGPGDDPSRRNGAGPVQLGRLCIDGLSRADADEFYTYQFLIRARPVPVPDYGVTSIVIVTYNEVEYTRQCLDSIRLVTDEPYELIVVDNGSTDGTVEFLRAISDVRVILNDTNRGFPAAANQGMALATGKQVLLLNNDVVVTTGWLFRMLRALRSDPSIGLVGPCSNFVSGPQQVEAGYDGIAELDGFAWDWGKGRDGQMIDVRRLVGFCLLIKREVIDAIGQLDERFGIGCFEDDDILRCLRGDRAAGYRAVIASDSFVHHYGSRTFIGSGVDGGTLMRENHRRFQDKWSGNGVGASAHPAASAISSPLSTPAGSPNQTPAARESVAVGRVTAAQYGVHSNANGGITQPDPIPRPFAIDIAPEGGLRLRPNLDRPKLSLCMIVRDNARTLPACLESIRTWVDEMIVVDTGSVDETPRIVESFGAKLFHFPWCDDFSAARNESLRHATGDWLFWMDSDDTIPPECGRGLRELVENQNDPSVVAYVMQVHCPGGGEPADRELNVTVVDHVKLFRNLPELRFDGRMHEQILGAIRRLGGDVAWTELYVVHSGSDQSPAAQARKLERDLRLLTLELAERPEHPFTLFNLGMTHVHANRFGDGAEYLRRSISRSNPGESHLRKAFALLVYAEMRQSHHAQALEACRRGRGLFPRDLELRFREGVLFHEIGRLDEARNAYLSVLSDVDDRHFSSVDKGLNGFMAHQNLAIVATDMGDLGEAERQWAEVVREAPRYRPGWRGMGDTLIREQRLADAEKLAGELMQDGPLHAPRG